MTFVMGSVAGRLGFGRSGDVKPVTDRQDRCCDNELIEADLRRSMAKRREHFEVPLLNQGFVCVAARSEGLASAEYPIVIFREAEGFV